MIWSYGITAVESRVLDGTLFETIASLRSAGFTAPIVFLDGGRPEAVEFIKDWGCPVVHHDNVGHLRNWCTALSYLYLTNAGADRFALFEDDLLCCSNLKEYLESCPYPARGYLNLLTHDSNLVIAGPTLGWFLSNQRGKGAVGLVFDREAVQALLTSKEFLDYSVTHSRRQAADGMTITLLKALGFLEYAHNPSLIQHTGLTSTFKDHQYGKVKGFRGEDYNPLSLIQGITQSV